MSGALDFLAPLFVPANRPERFEKAAQAGADAVILDLEDAVAPGAKDEARAAVRGSFTTAPVLVRVNGIGTPWHTADMAALAGNGFAAVIVPKAEADEAFAELCAASPIPVVALVESARGLADARRIAATRNVARIAFGSIDFCADPGCAHVREALLLARNELVLATRLSGLTAPVDGITRPLTTQARSGAMPATPATSASAASSPSIPARSRRSEPALRRTRLRLPGPTRYSPAVTVQRRSMAPWSTNPSASRPVPS